MKIMLIIRSLSIGGAQRQLLNLSNELINCGYQPIIVVFYQGGELENQLDSAIPLISLGKKGRWDFVRFLFRFGHAILQYKPDIVYSFLTTPNILSGSLKLFFPRFCVVWGKRGAQRNLKDYGLFESIVYWVECWLSHFVDLVIYNSIDIKKKSISQGFPENKAWVIPNGIDTDYFFPDVNSGARLRSEWNISPESILIGMVGRLDPIKGHKTFLEAFRLLAQARKDVYSICVGEGNDLYTQSIRALGEQLDIANRVIWVNFRTDMSAIYNSLDIFVSASYGESFPNTIGESMSCGIPCVVTDVGDSAFIVGDAGVVVRPQTPDELVLAINGVLSVLDSIDHKRIRQRVIDYFSLETMIESNIAMFRYVVNRNM